MKKTWSEVSSVGKKGQPPARFHHTAVLSADQDVMYVFGGRNDKGPLKDMWAFHFGTLPNALRKSWRSLQ